MAGPLNREQREAIRSAVEGIIMKKEDWSEFSSVANITFYARKCEELLEFLMNKFYMDELYEDATNLDDILNNPTDVEHAAHFSKIIQYARAKAGVADDILDDDVLQHEHLRRIVVKCAKEVQGEYKNKTQDHTFLKNIIKPQMSGDDMRTLPDTGRQRARDKMRYKNMKTDDDHQQAIVRKLLLLVSRELLTAKRHLDLGSCIHSVFYKSKQQQQQHHQHQTTSTTTTTTTTTITLTITATTNNNNQQQQQQQQKKQKRRFESTAYIVKWLVQRGISQTSAKGLYDSFDRIRVLRNQTAHFVGYSNDQEMKEMTRKCTAEFGRILESGLYELVFNDTRPLQVCFSMMHSSIAGI